METFFAIATLVIFAVIFYICANDGNEPIKCCNCNHCLNKKCLISGKNIKDDFKCHYCKSFNENIK